MNDTRSSERLAEAFAALGSTARLDILNALASDDGLDVGTLAQRIGHSVANTSQHLARLRHAGIVTSRRVGTRAVNQIDYRFVDDLDALVGMFENSEQSRARQ